jgi:S-methylmethionine-dependent homocysteine/selenocysteine methylase
MLNCNTLSKSNQCFNKFKKLWGGEWGIFPNLGQTEPEIDGKIDIMNSDEVFTNSILDYLSEGPSVIGSCCGSSPKHTKIIKEMIEKN